MADLNVLYGTCADGGSTPAGQAFADPTYANDDNVETWAYAANAVVAAGVWVRRLKTDLGAARAVEGMTVYYKSVTADFRSLEWSDDGSAWTDSGITPDAWYVDSHLGTAVFYVQHWTFPSVLTHRYWRMVRQETVPNQSAGLGYLPPIRPRSWIIDDAPPAQAGVYADWDGDGFEDADDDNLTADTASWRITRGASAEITGGAQQGACTLMLNNPADDRYNPLNASGPLYGLLRDGVPLWIGLGPDYLLDGNATYGLFGGRIASITPVPQGGLGRAAKVEITCEDELARLGRTPVTITDALDRSQGGLRAEVLEAAGVTQHDLANETATIPLSSVDGPALAALEDLNKASGARHFIRPGPTRDPWYLYTSRNRMWRLDGSIDASIDAGADHLTGTDGWRLSADTVINRQKVTVTPIRFTSRAQAIWEDRDVPYTIASGRPRTIWVEFDDFVAEAGLDIAKTGSSLTSAITNYGTTAKIVLTSSGSTSVTKVQVEGRMARRGNDLSAVEDDTASQADPRGVRAGTDLASPYTGALASAQGLARHIVWRYGSPQYRPTMTVVNWLPEQLEVDLFDVIEVTIDELAMTAHRFEVVGLTHECTVLADADTMSLTTTYVLQECRVQSDPGWFTLGASALGGTDVLAP